jgi:protease-4
MFDIEELAAGIGVRFDGVKTSRYADMDSLSRPKTPDELALLQKFTDRIYGDFIGLVAAGRLLARPEVERIAQGRVWSGSAALGLHLVDEIGGLDSAILCAQAKTGLSSEAPIVQIPGKEDPAETLASLFTGDSRRDPVATMRSPAKRFLRMTEENLRRIDNFNDRRHVYARIPYLLRLN